jgi:hypothetical protein
MQGYRQDQIEFFRFPKLPIRVEHQPAQKFGHLDFACVFKPVDGGHELLITGHCGPCDSKFFGLRNAISAKMVLALTTFKHNSATVAKRSRNGRNGAHAFRATVRCPQRIRFREYINDIGLRLCRMIDSGLRNKGVKKTVAYQAPGRKDRIEHDLNNPPCPIVSDTFQGAICMHECVLSQKI